MFCLSYYRSKVKELRSKLTEAKITISKQDNEITALKNALQEASKNDYRIKGRFAKRPEL